MNKNITVTGYKIAFDPDFPENPNALAPELSRQIENFHKMAMKGKRSSIPKLVKAIEKYPDSPQLKNYLSVLYEQRNDLNKALEINRRIVNEHPNYLFGKLNLANEYYLKEEYDKMPEILGDTMELKALYPQRETFHIIEVLSFYKCAILYFTAIGDIEQAEIRYNIMEEIAPEFDDTKFASKQILMARLKAGHERFKQEQKNRITVETNVQVMTEITEQPTFKHSEIAWLYANGLYIEKEKLQTLLQLPRKSLINDLEQVLEDSINRYKYFSRLTDKEGWDEETINFAVHAVFLLGELEAEESVDTIIKVLSQSEDYIELYFGDFITSGLWEPVYKIVNQYPDKCKKYLCTSGITTYAKTMITDVFEQVVYNQPARRNEVISWFRDVINFFLNSSIEDNVIDSDLIAFIICNILDFKGKELLPEIEQLFARDFVSKTICGDIKEVKKAFLWTDKYNKKKDFLSIAERYEEITSTWAGYNEDETSSFELPYDDEPYYDDYYEPGETFVNTAPKIGRNDPCPCGSGKKYKKCCLNKE
ncbi:MAG: DUF1186 domain-containing protein [Kiritimatiellae bacterium]|nr:DUF1186 domain-containing protein [Kiritimatiellia bacterium]